MSLGLCVRVRDRQDSICVRFARAGLFCAGSPLLCRIAGSAAFCRVRRILFFPFFRVFRSIMSVVRRGTEAEVRAGPAALFNLIRGVIGVRGALAWAQMHQLCVHTKHAAHRRSSLALPVSGVHASGTWLRPFGTD